MQFSYRYIGRRLAIVSVGVCALASLGVTAGNASAATTTAATPNVTAGISPGPPPYTHVRTDTAGYAVTTVNGTNFTSASTKVNVPGLDCANDAQHQVVLTILMGKDSIGYNDSTNNPAFGLNTTLGCSSTGKQEANVTDALFNPVNSVGGWDEVVDYNGPASGLTVKLLVTVKAGEIKMSIVNVATGKTIASDSRACPDGAKCITPSVYFGMRDLNPYDAPAHFNTVIFSDLSVTDAAGVTGNLINSAWKLQQLQMYGPDQKVMLATTGVYTTANYFGVGYGPNC